MPGDVEFSQPDARRQSALPDGARNGFPLFRTRHRYAVELREARATEILDIIHGAHILPQNTMPCGIRASNTVGRHSPGPLVAGCAIQVTSRQACSGRNVDGPALAVVVTSVLDKAHESGPRRWEQDPVGIGARRVRRIPAQSPPFIPFVVSRRTRYGRGAFSLPGCSWRFVLERRLRTAFSFLHSMLR